jgi:pyridine nucleotide-disulfide oxidoreductase family protein
MEKAKRLLLLGGGHAHVYLIKQFNSKKNKDFEVVLVSASQYQYYSGMAAGYLEGIYSHDEICFDLKKMCEKSGVGYIEARVTAIDPKERSVELDTNQTVSFDILSVDTGSEMAGKNLEGVKDYAWCVKPLGNLVKLKSSFIEQIQDGSEVVIAGAGAAGIEIALSLKALSQNMKKKIKITMVTSGSELLKGHPENVKQTTIRKLNQANIDTLFNHRIAKINKNNLIMASGDKIQYDLLVWAIGPAANKMYKDSGFTVDEAGYMLVNGYLQSVDYPNILGAGDCISFEGVEPLKKAGVYAIRQSPYLYNNIKRFYKSQDLRKYIPQKDYLAIISAGNKTGILQYKGIALTGVLVWKLKDYIDRSFMKRYQ